MVIEAAREDDYGRFVRKFGKPDSGEILKKTLIWNTPTGEISVTLTPDTSTLLITLSDAEPEFFGY